MRLTSCDRFLVSDRFLHLWDNLSIITLDRNFSDHCPLLLRDKVVDFGPKPFKVFDEWFNKDGVTKIIKDAWELPVRGSKKDSNFHDLLKNVKNALRSWSSLTFGGLDGEIKVLKDEIVGDGDLRKKKMKANMLKQKARVRWILEGDESSKYFHASILRRYNKSNIRGQFINGVWSENPIEIKSNIFNHFQNVFQQTTGPRPELSSWAAGTDGPSVGGWQILMWPS
ncbi:uncharacterized protein [Rutidosis leptorrhynchoides]|uniref:uncharacterized protein n=1 Tax=Rutidosis leptorrhynchoides TaxID=125765 RepID=UPI003A99ABD0